MIIFCEDASVNLLKFSLTLIEPMEKPLTADLQCLALRPHTRNRAAWEAEDGMGDVHHAEIAAPSR
jgi:hypothetical protein